MEQEIIEGNKLIAEFDNKHKEKIGEHRQICYGGFNIKDHGIVSCLEEHLRYDSSYDWLMPVVDKIEAKGYWVKIQFHDCEIGQMQKSGNIIGTKTNPNHNDNKNEKRKVVWEAIVEFIKWYNKNIPQEKNKQVKV